MKVAKIVVIVLLVYMGIVTAFESLIGTMQPAAGSTLVITTFDADGSSHDRVVSRLESDGHLYVAANHWPRAWYRRALANPDVQATIDGKKADYRAVPVTGDGARSGERRARPRHRLPDPDGLPEAAVPAAGSAPGAVISRRLRTTTSAALCSAFAALMSVAACDSRSPSNNPSAVCTEPGAQCALPDGPLGVCERSPCPEGAASPCFRCTPQH